MAAKPMTIKESGCAMILVGLAAFLFFLMILISILVRPPELPPQSPTWLMPVMYTFIGLIMTAGLILFARGFKNLMVWAESLPDWQKRKAEKQARACGK